MRENLWEQLTQNLYHGDNYRRMEEVYGFIRSQISMRKGLSILDIGCGDGSLFNGITDNKICGVDISQPQIKMAQQKGIDARLCNIDSENLPFEDKSFDILIASEVIEHVLIPDRILIESRRVLKDDGKLIITTPNLASFGKRLLLLFGKNPFIEISPLEQDAVGHIRYFIRSTFEKLAREHGFEIEYFTSDVINFDGSGHFRSRKLAEFFPNFGRTLIFILKKKNDQISSL